MKESPPKSGEESLNKKAALSTFWTISGYGSQQALRLASNLILTRILAPEMFGLLALAQVFIYGATMFSDIGINSSIVKHKKDNDSEFLNTAWTLQILRGLLIAIACVLIAYPISVAYNESQLFPVLSVLGLNAIIGGFKSTSFATAERNLQIGKKTAIEVVSQLMGIISMIIISYLYPSVWALVIGSIFSSLTAIVLGHTVLNNKHKHRISINPGHFSDIIHFGKWLFLSSIIGFFANQADKLILGKLFTLQELGIYSLAYLFAQLTETLHSQLGHKVMMPVYAKFQEASIRELRAQAYTMRLRVASASLVPALLFMCFGEELISALYDSRYHEAGWMLQVLSLGFAINAATRPGPYLLSLGKSKIFTVIVAIRTAVTVTCMLAGWHFFGKEGVIYALPVGNIISYCIQSVINARFKMWLWKLDFLLLAIVGGVYYLQLTVSM